MVLTNLTIFLVFFLLHLRRPISSNLENPLWSFALSAPRDVDTGAYGRFFLMCAKSCVEEEKKYFLMVKKI
jgi:hypothetical protein